VQVRPVPARYPMGSDKQLIQTLTGKEVPADARAAEVGVLVHNVSTCAAVHRALRRGEPLVERIVTLNGGAVTAPGNMLAPIGTLVVDLLRFAGVTAAGTAGPRRADDGQRAAARPGAHRQGRVRHPRLRRAEAHVPEAGPCIRCGSCTTCLPDGPPAAGNGQPHPRRRPRRAVRFGLSDCIACGCCAYVCPSHIPLVQYFSHAKGELSARERTKLRNDATRRLAEERVVAAGTRSARKGGRRSQTQGRARSRQGRRRLPRPARRRCGRQTRQRGGHMIPPRHAPRLPHRTPPAPSSVSRVMLWVVAALLPATLYGFWLYGWPAVHLWWITVGSASSARPSACAWPARSR
jgi:electron transport complex protein RnfC